MNPELFPIEDSSDPLSIAREKMFETWQALQRAELLLEEQGPEATPVVHRARSEHREAFGLLAAEEERRIAASMARNSFPAP